MSTSTNGHISYGILLDEDFEPPWEDEEGDGDIEDWWRKETGYVAPFELFGPDGNYLPHIELTKDKWGDETIKDRQLLADYLAAPRGWDALHPLPVDMVNTCSGESPIWIIAVPGTRLEARRGYPEKFDPAALVVDETVLAAFSAFCEKYGIDGEPSWYLGSYYG